MHGVYLLIASRYEWQILLEVEKQDCIFKTSLGCIVRPCQK